MKSLRLKSINVQRLSLQFLIEQGYLDHRTAMQLRQYINHEENLQLQIDPI